MKKIATFACGVMFALSSFAQTDPVVMTINGKDITRSEFEYSFNKNNADGVLDKKSVDDYVQLFVDFKLKVAAAEDAGVDTLLSIKNELTGYREQLILPTLVDEDFIEEKAKETYNATAARFAGADLLKASHILVLMRQDATAEQQTKAKARIDSIYNVLVGGADFAEVAKNCSDDKGSAQRGGSLGQFGKGMMIPDFENAAYALQPGEMSKPIKSTVGWHIIKLEDRHPFEPYEFHRPSIVKFLEARGIKEASANSLLEKLSAQTGKTRTEVLDSLCEDYLAKDADARYLAQEYYDGTLMYEMSKKHIWDKAAKDNVGLAEYFSKNKKSYIWDAPRFCGIVIFAKDEATLKAAKKALKKVDEDKWSQTLVKTFNTDSVKMLRVERGIYKQGESPYVDYLVFKQGEAKQMKDFPIAGVHGKKSKKPRSYKDVRGQVTTDYQSELEKQWVESLRTKYPVVINKETLATVNKH